MSDANGAQALKWAAPSGRTSGSQINAHVASSLKLRPDEWAVIEETPLQDAPVNPTEEEEEKYRAEVKNTKARSSNKASLIKQGRLKPFAPKGSFEAASRTELDDDPDSETYNYTVVRVYARYLSPDNRVIVEDSEVPLEGSEVPAEDASLVD